MKVITPFVQLDAICVLWDCKVDITEICRRNLRGHAYVKARGLGAMTLLKDRVCDCWRCREVELMPLINFVNNWKEQNVPDPKDRTPRKYPAPYDRDAGPSFDSANGRGAGG